MQVGPGKTYTTPSAAAAVAQSGDRILIDPVDYRGDVATWSAPNLTICGDGGRARLYADGKNAQGKGTWVIAVPNSATTTIVNVQFHDSKVQDKNGAGIRHEGGNLVLRNTGFFDNENGILGGGGPVTVTIERSEFARNGYGDGFSHNIYIGNVDRLRVVASWFHEAKIGHNLKSRAKENIVENSYFMDGPTGTSSYLLDFPDGGVVFMRGNLLHKGPMADNTTAVAYGAERNMWTDQHRRADTQHRRHDDGPRYVHFLRRLYAAGHAHGEPLCRQRGARERDCGSDAGPAEQLHDRRRQCPRRGDGEFLADRRDPAATGAVHGA